MSQTGKSGYTNVVFDPNKYDTYLVKTVTGCYDFALFDINGWSNGIMTGAAPHYWMPIPQHD